MAEIITSEVLYDILRKEKVSAELQQLDKNFYKNIIKYLQDKTNLIETQKDNVMFAKEITKINKEVEAVKRMLKELYERRENKIIQNALFLSKSRSKDETLPLLPEERKFFKSVLETVELYRKSVLDNLISARLPLIEEPPKDIKTVESPKQLEENLLVRLIHPVPKFVGTDFNIYGPFEQEDVSLLPKQIAELLINKNRAEEIKNESS
ncbi:MAG: hypothetical protein AABY07_05325 [Nanoarchaeota archaeon]